MDARTRNYFVLVMVFVVGIAAAGALLLGGNALGGPDAAREAPPNADQIVGVVVQVQSEGLTNVRGFSLRTDSDTDMLFALDRLENAAEFPPGHLVEHQASSTPIRVWFRTEGGINYAIRLEDADQTGASGSTAG